MTKAMMVLLVFCFFLTPIAAQEKMSKTLYHPHNSAVITPASTTTLQELVQTLQGFNIQLIQANAHADKTGTSAYNKTLSQQRAAYVLDLLKQQLGGDVRTEVNAYGSEQPVTDDADAQELNRRTEIVIWYTVKTNTTPTQEQEKKANVKLTPYVEDVAAQRFTINLDDTVRITAQQGTHLVIAPGSFTNKQGTPATGTATLLLKEYYTPEQILLAGLHTISDSGLLQTGGMFKAYIVQGNDTLPQQAKKPVQVQMNDVNNLGSGMNVFVMSHDDTAMWSTTGRSFTWQNGFWAFPARQGKLKDFIAYSGNFTSENITYSSLAIGKELERAYVLRNGGKKYDNRYMRYVTTDEVTTAKLYKPLAKTLSYTVKKVDSVTLRVSLHERFRNRGYRRFKQRNFDTTFEVKYAIATYNSYVDGLNFINCDRFLNVPDKTNIYVNTPGFEGAQLLLYFPKLNAFMTQPMINGNYGIPGVPVGENVKLIALGKKGEQYYYASEPYKITRDGNVDLALQPVEYADMKKVFKALGYQ